MSCDFFRCDIICDRYFPKSLKEVHAANLGEPQMFNFDDETNITSNID